MGHKFFEKSEITDTDLSYEEYLEKVEWMDEYFKYNSVMVIRCKIPKKENTSSEWS